jgi:hypothetical protein
MPATPYTRILLDGIPFWKDNADGKLYYYASSTYPVVETRICIGAEATGLVEGWQDLLAPTLRDYQATQTARIRETSKKSA